MRPQASFLWETVIIYDNLNVNKLRELRPHFPDLVSAGAAVMLGQFLQNVGSVFVSRMYVNNELKLPFRVAHNMKSHSARRCAAIDQYRILDTPAEPGFEDITKLAALICNADFAAISFVCKDRQWFKSEVGLGISETPISASCCAHAIQQSDVFVVTDARIYPELADNPLVTAPPGIRFYAGMPISSADGTPIATLCVLDQQARPNGLTEVEQLSLRVLARQIEAQLELRRSILDHDTRAAEQ